MTIEIKSETLINLHQAASLLPPGRNGRPIHLSTLVRGITLGVNGHKLDALKIGGRWITSVEALQRWAEAQHPGQKPQPKARTTNMRSREDDRADRALKKLGI